MANSSASYPNKALSEAASIIFSQVEIDWSKDPRTEAERALRAAMIHRVESNAKAKVLGTALEPQFADLKTYLDLKRLTNFSEPCGCDLQDAIDRWHRVLDEDREQRDRAEQAELLEQARTDLISGYEGT